MLEVLKVDWWKKDGWNHQSYAKEKRQGHVMKRKMWDCYRVKNGKKSSKEEKEQIKTGGTEGKQLIEVENLKNMKETLHLLEL